MNKQLYALTKILKKPKYLFEVSVKDGPAFCFLYRMSEFDVEIRDLWEKTHS